MICKNELIIKNRINNRIKKDLDDYNGNSKCKGIKDIRYLFNEEDIYNGINDIKYLFNENEGRITYKDSPFKSIIQDIKRGLCYVEKMSNLSTSDIKNIKEKLVKFKNELFFNNSKIKKDPNECKGIKYIRYLFNEDKNKKSDLYKIGKMKNKTVSEIKKDFNEYKGIKDIRYLFNDN